MDSLVERFDVQHFNYEKCYMELRKSIKKPNILVCGATGVGKSSIVNDLLVLNGNQGATVGSVGRPETRGVNKYSSDDSTFNLYDTEGYEIGTEKQEIYRNNILGFIDKKLEDYPNSMEEHIHEVWYCVSAGNKRFFDLDEKMIIEIWERSIPVMVLITKVDMVDEDELNALKTEIHERVPMVEYFTYSLEIPEDPEYDEVREMYVQRDAILEWAVSHLDDSLRGGFIPAIKNSIAVQRKYILDHTVPGYIASAVVAVVGNTVNPVPFMDSVVLMGIQVKMAMDIVNSYGIDSGAGKVVTDIVGTSVVSYVGRTIAGELTSLIPYVGPAVKTAVNTTVAATVTGVLGAAIALVCEQYLKVCVDKSVSEPMAFTDFISVERMKEALNYVNTHKAEFHLDEIIAAAIKKNKKEDTKTEE